ncbi:MAG TPA: 2-amino-4-hydroxy-6-hydroxymethyldihydropteridine diphosphokinase [Candidatus Hydrogenedentes bacterium]|nr:2-amino-4-hydroxy-6-hydroxymethyldihydropteridine diphosphokinase [Candidatus Hydrogenedentota bacterium]
MAPEAAARAADVFVSVGANIEPERHIPAALDLLREAVPITAISTFYVTAPIGAPEQADYLNGVVAVECTAAPRAFKFETLRAIEAALGRVRTADRFAARTIDLDIALFGDTVLREPDLEIPDPDLRSRPFLVAAILELAPVYRLPDSGAPLAALLHDADRACLRPAVAFTRNLRERFGV